ncbi:hypothetical protein ACWEFJ_01175 [Actinosynnema sp. NPDC004786]
MAAPEAVRRGGSLLLRALAVGGLATAAWLVCAGVATADEDHSDEATKTLEAVNLTLGEQRTAVARLLADAAPQHVVPFLSVAAEPQPVGAAPFLAPGATADPIVVTPFVPYAAEGDPYPAESYAYSSSSGYSHSGTVSNTMPAPVYEAKAAAKAAARAAATAEPVVADVPPAPTPVAEPVRTAVPPAPPATAPPAAVPSQTASDTEVRWEAPEPSAPAPAPKQAPAPTAPTASSGGADSGSGHRGGGVFHASLTGQSTAKPWAAWSAERWDDDRSPGSVPGLPSTSPD